MPLESTTTIEGLVSSNPIENDNTTQGNDHLQLLKVVLKNIFPGAATNGFAIPITASEAELNFVDGVTSSIQAQLDSASSLIGAETSARIAADSALQLDVDTNEADSDAANLVLQNNIDAEAGTRFSADTTLQTNIDNEAGTRAAADSALDSRVTVLESAGSFPSGTRMLFSQSAAPTGWSQDPSQNDRMIRLVSGVGGGVGGSDSPIALSQNMAHVHATSGHALSVAEMPSHTHTYSRASTFEFVASGVAVDVADNILLGSTTGATGSNAAHSHGNTGSGGGTVSFSMRYQNVIVASKN